MIATVLSATVAGALMLPAGAPAPQPDPLTEIAAQGLAKTGDLIHAVPLFGPIATGVLELPFCVARGIPIIGGIASAAVSAFDADQRQNACQPGATSSGGPGSTAPSKQGLPESAPGLSIPGASSGTGTHGGPSSLLPLGPPSASLPPASLPPAAPAPPAALPPAALPPAAPAPPAAAAKPAEPAKPAKPHGPVIAAHFPNVRFQMREGRGQSQACLVTGTSSATRSDVVSGPCGQTAIVWLYQSSTRELHLATDSTRCLTAPSSNLQLASVQRCDAVKPWQRRWFLSPGYRLYISDTDQHGSYRFIGAPGAPGALVVGGAEGHALSAVPTWGFQLA